MERKDFNWMDEMAQKVVFDGYEMTAEEEAEYKRLVAEYAKKQERELCM